MSYRPVTPPPENNENEFVINRLELLQMLQGQRMPTPPPEDEVIIISERLFDILRDGNNDIYINFYMNEVSINNEARTYTLEEFLNL